MTPAMGELVRSDLSPGLRRVMSLLDRSTLRQPISGKERDTTNRYGSEPRMSEGDIRAP